MNVSGSMTLKGRAFILSIHVTLWLLQKSVTDQALQTRYKLTVALLFFIVQEVAHSYITTAFYYVTLTWSYACSIATKLCLVWRARCLKKKSPVLPDHAQLCHSIGTNERRRLTALYPPSTIRLEPVMNEEASLNANNAAPLYSFASDNRPSMLPFSHFFFSEGSSLKFFSTIGVMMLPGHSVFTRIGFPSMTLPHSIASDLASCMTAWMTVRRVVPLQE